MQTTISLDHQQHQIDFFYNQKHEFGAAEMSSH